MEDTKNLFQELHRLKDSFNTMKKQQQQQHSSNTKNQKTTSDKTKNVKGKNVKAKNIKTRSTASTSGKNKKEEGSNSNKNTKYKLDRNSVGNGRGEEPPRGRSNASIEGRGNREGVPSRDSSKSRKRTSRTGHGGQLYQS